MKIKDATVMLGMLEDGQLMRDFSASISDTLRTLREQAGARDSLKGSVTLVINLSVQGDTVEIEPTLSAKTPPPKRGKSFFWTIGDDLSTEHPRQTNLFEDVNAKGQSNG